MYKQLLFASALSLGLAVVPTAMAKPDSLDARGKSVDRGHAVEVRQWNGSDRHDRDQGRGHDRRDDHRNDHRDDHRNDWKHAARERQWREGRYRVAPYRAPHGYYRHAWRAGERLPSGYRHTRYVVHDYRSYRLYSPPRGHQWVRVDHDVVLTALATGVVAAVVYNIFQ